MQLSQLTRDKQQLQQYLTSQRLIGRDQQYPLPRLGGPHGGGGSQGRLAHPALADEQADPGAGVFQPSTRFFRSFNAVSVSRFWVLRLSSPIIGIIRSTDSS